MTHDMSPTAEADVQPRYGGEFSRRGYGLPA